MGGHGKLLFGLACLGCFLVDQNLNADVNRFLDDGTGGGSDHGSERSGNSLLHFLGVFFLGATIVSTLLFWGCLSAKTRAAVQDDIRGNLQTNQHRMRGFFNKNKDYNAHSDNMIPVVCTIAAALIMHVPGLYCRVLYRQNIMGVVGALLGSITEGVFLLLLYTKSILVAQQLYNNLVHRYQRQRVTAGQNELETGNSGGSLFLLLEGISLLQLLQGAMLLALVLGTILLLCFSVASSIGDYTFQHVTSGVIPDMWALAAGYKEAQSQIEIFKAGGLEAVAKVILVVTCFVASFVLYGWGQYHAVRQQQASAPTTTHAGVSVSNCLLLTTMLLALTTYQLGLWQPVMHATLSLFGSFVLTPPGHGQQLKKVTKLAPSTNAANQDLQTKGPNVIYIVHESLSGAYWLNRKEARQHTPFFNSLAENDNFYVFPHARSVSGDTTDAFTALATGCLPIDKEGRDLAFSRSIATEFKQQGYDTASFSVRSTQSLAGTKWFMIHNYLAGNMDYLADPASENMTEINGPAGNDRDFARRFTEWSSNRTTANPLFAQFYMFNSHHPYVPKNPKSKARGLKRYYETMESIDESLQIVFDHLNQTGQLNNTIVVGSGDHGEMLEGKGGRLWHWNPYVLQPLTYMYIPKELAAKKERDRLRRNTQKLVSTLDLYPTLQRFAYSGGNVPAKSDLENAHCILGMDLMEGSIPSDRATFSWNPVSVQGFKNGAGILSTISTRDRGLYAHGKKRKLILEEMKFGNCTSSPDSDHNCVYESTEADLDYWRGVLGKLGNSTNIAGRKSFVMESIRDKLKMPSLRST